MCQITADIPVFKTREYINYVGLNRAMDGSPIQKQIFSKIVQNRRFLFRIRATYVAVIVDNDTIVRTWSESRCNKRRPSFMYRFVIESYGTKFRAHIGYYENKDYITTDFTFEFSSVDIERALKVLSHPRFTKFPIVEELDLEHLLKHCVYLFSKENL